MSGIRSHQCARQGQYGRRATLGAEVALMIDTPPKHDKLMAELDANLRKLAKFLHAYPLACVSQAGDRPSTTALVRWQAKHGHTVTTLRHSTIEATGGIETRLLTLLGAAAAGVSAGPKSSVHLPAD